MTLFGWDLGAWERVIEHRDGLRATDVFDERKWLQLLAVRRRWLERGGPLSGPSGLLDA